MTTLPGPDGRPRCCWCTATPDYLAYHDDEWGFPVADDRRLFEKLCLEGFQSGPELADHPRKRENFRARLRGLRRRHGRALRRRATSTRLLQRRRHRAPPRQDRGDDQQRAARARAASTSSARWPPTSGASSRAELAAEAHDAGGADGARTSAESVAMSKDLKRRGWSFVGPTTVYAFMQAMGLVNDHLDGCAHAPRWSARARRSSRRDADHSHSIVNGQSRLIGESRGSAAHSEGNTDLLTVACICIKQFLFIATGHKAS